MCNKIIGWRNLKRGCKCRTSRIYDAVIKVFIVSKQDNTGSYVKYFCLYQTFGPFRTELGSADKTAIQFLAFAGAAFARKSSDPHFAAQRISPERPFTGSKSGIPKPPFRCARVQQSGRGQTGRREEPCVGQRSRTVLFDASPPASAAGVRGVYHARAKTTWGGAEGVNRARRKPLILSGSVNSAITDTPKNIGGRSSLRTYLLVTKAHPNE
jgi:hypothetical protein